MLLCHITQQREIRQHTALLTLPSLPTLITVWTDENKPHKIGWVWCCTIHFSLRKGTLRCADNLTTDCWLAVCVQETIPTSCCGENDNDSSNGGFVPTGEEYRHQFWHPQTPRYRRSHRVPSRWVEVRHTLAYSPDHAWLTGVRLLLLVPQSALTKAMWWLPDTFGHLWNLFLRWLLGKNGQNLWKEPSIRPIKRFLRKTLAFTWNWNLCCY